MKTFVNLSWCCRSRTNVRPQLLMIMIHDISQSYLKNTVVDLFHKLIRRRGLDDEYCSTRCQRYPWWSGILSEAGWSWIFADESSANWHLEQQWKQRLCRSCSCFGTWELTGPVTFMHKRCAHRCAGSEVTNVHPDHLSQKVMISRPYVTCFKLRICIIDWNMCKFHDTQTPAAHKYLNFLRKQGWCSSSDQDDIMK